MTAIPYSAMLAILGRPAFAVVRLILNNLQQKTQRRVAAETLALVVLERSG